MDFVDVAFDKPVTVLELLLCHVRNHLGWKVLYKLGQVCLDLFYLNVDWGGQLIEPGFVCYFTGWKLVFRLNFSHEINIRCLEIQI